MSKTHNMSGTRLYRIWNDMKVRCSHKDNDNYPYYGGRGIAVCDEWESSFETFMQWAESSGYSEGLTLDRINTNGNYEPSNCRWIEFKAQCRNRRNNIFYELNGESKIIAEWSEIYDIPSATIWRRINKYGWDVKTAITAPVGEMYTYKGRSMTLPDWSKELNIKYSTLRARIKTYKWPIDKAFEYKVKRGKQV